MIARPRPLRAATTGSSTGSAYGATNRTTTCATTTRRGQPAAVGEDVGRDLALDAEAHRGVRADADGQRQHEQEQLGPAPAAVHELHDHPGLAHGVALTESVGVLWGGRVARGRGGLGRARVDGVVDGLVGGQAADGVLGVVEAVGVDALADGRGVVVGEAVEGDVGGLVRLRQADAGEVGVDAPEDRDGAVVVADVELLLAPGVRRRPDDPGHAQHGDAGEHPAGEQEAARWPRRVPRLLGVDRVGLDRERHVVGISARTGSSSPVSPARWPRNRCGIVGRCDRRLRSAAAPTSIGCWSPGSSSSSTMSATTQVTLSVVPASRLARTSSTAA